MCIRDRCGTATNKAPMFVVDYFDPIDMNGKYYGDFNITGEYQEAVSYTHLDVYKRQVKILR